MRSYQWTQHTNMWVCTSISLNCESYCVGHFCPEEWMKLLKKKKTSFFVHILNPTPYHNNNIKYLSELAAYVSDNDSKWLNNSMNKLQATFWLIQINAGMVPILVPVIQKRTLLKWYIYNHSQCNDPRVMHKYRVPW